MKKWIIASGLYLLFASNTWSIPRQFCDGFYMNLGSGVNFLHVNRNAYVTTGPRWPDDRYVRRSTENTALISAGAGYTWFNNATFEDYWLPFISVGLSYTYVFESQVRGDIEQYSLTQFTNYNYQYKVERQTVLALIKLDLYRWRVVMPYIVLGAGASFNRGTNFTEQSRTDVTPRVNPGFNSNTQTHSSFMGGVGLDFMVQENLWASFEYDYGFYGYTKTGYGTNSENISGFNYSNSSLSNKITSSSAMVSLTYLIGM